MRLVGRDGATSMSATRSTAVTAGLVTTGVLLPLLILTLEPWTTLHVNVFCLPAAHLVAGFLGAPLSITAEGGLIHAAWPIEVTTACSGIRFFALTLAVLAGLAVEQRRSGWHWLVLPLIAYAGTIAANVSRILSTWYIDAWMAPHLPRSLQAGLHGLTGALVFSSVLAALYIVLWRTHHEHRTQTTTS